MKYTANLKYSQNLLRKSTYAFWRRSLGFGALLSLLLLFGVMLWQILSGNNSWLYSTSIVSFIFCIFIMVLVYLVHYRNALAKLREMKLPEATFVAEQEAFTISSGIGSSTLKWEAIKEVWCYQEFWVLIFSRAHFSTIPLENVSPEMQAYVSCRVKEAGGKVVS